jgi:hypothetical protein
MGKSSDPTKDPGFQKAVQALLRAPPQPHKKKKVDEKKKPRQKPKAASTR